MKCLIPIFFLILAAEANSQNSVTVWGYGATESCGQWLADRKDSEARESIGKHWVLGFLNGQSFNAKIDALGTIDGEAVFAEVDKYCRDKPRDKVVTATADLFKKMSTKGK